MFLSIYAFPILMLVIAYRKGKKSQKLKKQCYNISLRKEENKQVKLAINALYFFGVFSFFALFTYAEYCARGWWAGNWNGYYGRAPLIPFLHHFMRLEPFNIFVSMGLVVGTIPMLAATFLFDDFNNFSDKKYASIKKVIIWIPAALYVMVFLSVVIGFAMNVLAAIMMSV